MGHTEECRRRISDELAKDNNPRWEKSMERLAREVEMRVKRDERESSGSSRNQRRRTTLEGTTTADDDDMGESTTLRESGEEPEAKRQRGGAAGSEGMDIDEVGLGIRLMHGDSVGCSTSQDVDEFIEAVWEEKTLLFVGESPARGLLRRPRTG